MTGPSPSLDVETAGEQIRAGLAPGGDRRLGVEIEWIVVDREHPDRSVPADEALAAATQGGDLPGGSTASVEPGGQVELNAPHPMGAVAAAAVAAADAATLAQRMEAAGLALDAVGLDPHRSAPLSLRTPRYLAVERVFSRAGPSPMHMATNSAGLQVNVDLGDDPVRRWRRATMLGPVLVALFANSPAMHGRLTGWSSTRMLLWSTVPDGRARSVSTWRVDDWVDHVLDTPLLLIRSGDDATPILDGFTFRRWLRDGHPLGHPTADDLAYHLTTLWPPVRPRGWLELRMMDTVPLDGVPVALAVADALIAGPAGLDGRLTDICAGVAGHWNEAARHASAAPHVAAAAAGCLELTAELTADADLAARCVDWADRYPRRRRAPADDVVDRLGLGTNPPPVSRP